MSNERERERLRERHRLGPTGRYPAGRSDRPNDDGELRAALQIEGDRIVLDFGRTLSWLSMTPAQARTIARELLRRVETLERRGRS